MDTRYILEIQISASVQVNGRGTSGDVVFCRLTLMKTNKTK